MKLALDSNVLLYLARVWRVADDQAKKAVIDSVLLRLSLTVVPVVPFQVLGECYHVMLRYGYDRARCRTILLDWVGRFESLHSTKGAFLAAIDLATDHKLQFWDALIISVAAEAGCNLLLSEDLHSGFTWRGVTIVNPFANPLDARLARLLDPAE